MPVNPIIQALANAKGSVNLDGQSFEFKRPGFTNADIEKVRNLELLTPDDVASLTDFILKLRRAKPESTANRELWLQALEKLEAELNAKAEAFFKAGGARLYLERQFEVN